MAKAEIFDNIFNFQQVAVKLYEKDPSKLTSVDEPLPTVSTSSDLSDEEDSNLAAPDIKEEPVEPVVPNMTVSGPRPGAHQAPGHSHHHPHHHHHDRPGSFSSGMSGQEEQSTDSDTVS